MPIEHGKLGAPRTRSRTGWEMAVRHCPPGSSTATGLAHRLFALARGFDWIIPEHRGIRRKGPRHRCQVAVIDGELPFPQAPLRHAPGTSFGADGTGPMPASAQFAMLSLVAPRRLVFWRLQAGVRPLVAACDRHSEVSSMLIRRRSVLLQAERTSPALLGWAAGRAPPGDREVDSRAAPSFLG